MKLAPGAPLSLSLAFDPSGPRLPIGRLALDGGLAQLEWSREVIARQLSVAGLLYPPEGGLWAARGRAFEGLHGFLADSLPEGWVLKSEGTSPELLRLKARACLWETPGDRLRAEGFPSVAAFLRQLAEF